MQKNINLHITVFFMALLLMGCNSEDKPKPTTQADIFLGQEIKQWLENYAGTYKVFFKNSSGGDVVFYVSEIVDTLTSYNINDKIGRSQIMSVALTSDWTSKPIHVELVAWPEFEKTSSHDALNVRLGKLSSSTKEGDGLLFYYENNTGFSVINDSIMLNNKIYYDVIESIIQFPKPKYEIKYSKKEGIIFIKDNFTNEILIYDRRS